MARSSSDFDEAQGSLLGCPQPIRLILSPAHSCQQQAFTEHPLYFTRFLWRWGEHSFPTGSTMLALETSQKPSVSRGHSQPQGPGDIAKEISPFYLAASGGESADLCTRCARGREHFIIPLSISSWQAWLAFIRTTWPKSCATF